MSEILIIVLLAILLDHLIPDRQGIKPFAWYRDWAESIEERFNGGKRTHGIGAVLLATLPIVAGVLLIHYILGELGWILRIAFDVVVLYLCLDVHRLGKTANAISNALESGELGEADEKLRELVGKGAPERTDANIARAAVEGVLKQGNSLIVSPIFWFILLGPVGALLFCLAVRLKNHCKDLRGSYADAVRNLHNVLIWPAARLLALGFALAGSLVDALEGWRDVKGYTLDNSGAVITESAIGAIQFRAMDKADEQAQKAEYLARIQEVQALINRTLIIWLTILGLMTLRGILG